MPLTVEIAGRPPLDLHYLLLDVNGTLTDRGVLLPGVEERLRQLRDQMELHLLSADTFGTLEQVATQLGVSAMFTPDREAKIEAISALGADRCAAIGNGANDAAMLTQAALGIAVIGPEGAAATALVAADLVVRSITEAFDLLLEPRALAASLHG